MSGKEQNPSGVSPSVPEEKPSQETVQKAQLSFRKLIELAMNPSGPGEANVDFVALRFLLQSFAEELHLMDKPIDASKCQHISEVLNSCAEPKVEDTIHIEGEKDDRDPNCGTDQVKERAEEAEYDVEMAEDNESLSTKESGMHPENTSNSYHRRVVQSLEQGCQYIIIDINHYRILLTGLSNAHSHITALSDLFGSRIRTIEHQLTRVGFLTDLAEDNMMSILVLDHDKIDRSEVERLIEDRMQNMVSKEEFGEKCLLHEKMCANINDQIKEGQRTYINTQIGLILAQQATE